MTDKNEQGRDEDRSDIIFFAEGLPGFEEEKEYFLIPLQAPSPFFYLKSAFSELCLLMADPFVFFPDYEIDLPDSLVNNLGEEEGITALMVFCILNMGKDFQDTTANLLAPVIINAKSKKGIQYIQEKADYSTRHPIFKQVGRQPEPACQGGR